MKEEFDHIDDLIGKYLSGEASEHERTQVEGWIAIDDSNKNRFNQFKLIFERARLVKDTQVFDTDKAWLRVKSKLAKPRAKTIQFSPYWNALRVAAALLVTAGVSYFVYQWMNVPDQVITIVAQKEIVRDTLPDGSLAVLNKSSTLKYAYNTNSNQRKVKLEGEAFFDVKHQEDKPFIIETNEVIIEDIGTTFNVSAFPDSPTIEVYVETGEVAFYTLKDTGLNLVAGETGVYHKANKSFARLLKTDTNRLAYKTGIFSFRNADLETIVNDLNSVYEGQIRLSNDAIKNCRLNVAFKNEKLEDIVEIIAETLRLTVTKEGEDYVLNGNGCGN
ncbi:MAG: FecR domain-containing protein [Cyclobacteriaceae bacterium]